MLVNRFKLRFYDSEEESAFWARYATRSLTIVRVAFALGFIQLALFGLLDRWRVPIQFLDDVTLIRVIACSLIGMGFAYSWTGAFTRTMQVVVMGVSITCGGAIALMVFVVGDTTAYYHYYASEMLILFFVYVLSRLRFIYATSVGWAISVLYVVAAVAVDTPPVAVLRDIFYLVSSNLTGMFAAYGLEYYARRVYTQNRVLVGRNAALAVALRDLRTAKDQLVQQEKVASLGRLTAGIAHEIKNPLNFVVNFGKLLTEHTDELRVVLAEHLERPAEETAGTLINLLDDISEGAHSVAEHGQRADVIIHSMLDHSRVTLGARSPIAINGLVKEYVGQALAAYAARCGERGAPEVVWDLDSEAGTLDAAADELGRAVVNLVDNALRAVEMDIDASRRPCVTIRTRRADETLTLEVTDNGVGIAADDRERLFEPFFTRRPPGAGTGLGLSISHDTVVAHGGTLTFESDEGIGTTFTMTFPLRHGEARVASAA